MGFMMAWHSWGCSHSWNLGMGNFLHLPAPTDQQSWCGQRAGIEQGALERSSLSFQGIQRSAREGAGAASPPPHWILCSHPSAGGAQRAEPGSAGALLMTDTPLGTDTAGGTNPAFMAPGPRWLLPRDIPSTQLSSRENQGHQERRLWMRDEISRFNYPR